MTNPSTVSSSVTPMSFQSERGPSPSANQPAIRGRKSDGRE